jgi:hypothetical protein
LLHQEEAEASSAEEQLARNNPVTDEVIHVKVWLFCQAFFVKLL